MNEKKEKRGKEREKYIWSLSSFDFSSNDIDSWLLLQFELLESSADPQFRAL